MSVCIYVTYVSLLFLNEFWGSITTKVNLNKYFEYFRKYNMPFSKFKGTSE